VEGDKLLFNPYGVIAVDPKKNPSIQGELAQNFIDWIISMPVQQKISEFGMANFGRSLFIPNSNPWRVAHGTPTPAP
jgi:tungstate transport system substrate-binding protein